MLIINSEQVFPILTNLKRGEALSSLPFNCHLEYSIKQAKENHIL